MAQLKGTKTEKNLLTAFAGESQAKNRYEFFAKQAKKEGFEQISAIFMQTAKEEQAHAKRFFKFMEGGVVEITASYPAGIVGTTAENLKAAADTRYELPRLRKRPTRHRDRESTAPAGHPLPQPEPKPTLRNQQ